MQRLFPALIAVVAVLLLVNLFGPRETVDWTVTFSTADLGEDLDGHFQALESEFDNITPGAEKEIVWAGARGIKTPLSVVYVHGFSATKQELRPVPDKIAAALGANLFYTRLTGHGRSGDDLARVTANDWLNDIAEAVAVGERLGDRVLIVATSQGGTMVTMTAIDRERMENVAGIVLVSPNFGINSPMAGLLTAPFSASFIPMISGSQRSWEPVNGEHEKWWTTSYPISAVFPMAAAVNEALALPFEEMFVPAFFIYSPDDKVVRSAAIADVAARWGGRKDVWVVDTGTGNDPSNHVLGGDILSPGLTDEMVARILAWVETL